MFKMSKMVHPPKHHHTGQTINYDTNRVSSGPIKKLHLANPVNNGLRLGK